MIMSTNKCHSEAKPKNLSEEDPSLPLRVTT
jgi:hypothetical protein